MRWVAVVTGDYGVAAELIVPLGADVAGVIFDDIEQNENFLATQLSLVLRTFKAPGTVRLTFPFDPQLPIPETALAKGHLRTLAQATLTSQLSYVRSAPSSARLAFSISPGRSSHPSGSPLGHRHNRRVRVGGYRRRSNQRLTHPAVRLSRAGVVSTRRRAGLAERDALATPAPGVWAGRFRGDTRPTDRR